MLSLAHTRAIIRETERELLGQPYTDHGLLANPIYLTTILSPDVSTPSVSVFKTIIQYIHSLVVFTECVLRLCSLSMVNGE